MQRPLARPRLLVALLTLASLLIFRPVHAQPAPVDLLIRGGTIYDGSGSAPYIADLAISGDRIVAVGQLSSLSAKRIIDAAGLCVTPGFIDPHSHAVSGLLHPDTHTAHALLAQGITTVLINPDGGGTIDLLAQRRELELRTIGVNVAQTVGHNTLRGRAMGGSHNRPPTAEEMDKMRHTVRTAMQGGAFGMSSGLFYTPGNYAATEEIIDLARIVAEFDGIHNSHIRDEADYSIGVVESVREIIRISRESGVVGIVTHVKALGPNVWGASRQICAEIALARAEGVEVYLDQYPYEASSTGLHGALVPAWARDSSEGGLRGRLENAQTFARIRAEMIDNLARRGGPDRIVLLGPEEAVGLTLAQYAQRHNLDPVDAAIQLVRERPPSIISFNMHEDDIEHFMRQPFTLTCSDGGLPQFGRGLVHPRSYGAFARKIRKYVRERNTITLEHAVHTATAATARALRIADRGTIRPGAFADVLVFDFQKVNDPADFLKPHALSEGMVYVLVNGALCIDAAQPTAATPGRVLSRHD